ncbi:hypothetical protein PAMC26577_28945 [Caballeronia sordidicola]|uniref:Uncharacterized protein n=1 Tax=Caballeronia sordidicola TaxID=196367 RepID=A0A242MEM4_CABSO|nr:hypothetical protein PAMC26577_28945 [Caballeronia sordidicola]
MSSITRDEYSSRRVDGTVGDFRQVERGIDVDMFEGQGLKY